MGVGWADAHARKRVRDIDTFDRLLLEPLQQDVVEYTWLYERYDTAGQQTRTPFYFEYPSLVTMMLTEIRYGVEMGLASLTVNPFRKEEQASQPFAFSFGGVDVKYDPSPADPSAPVAALRFLGQGVERKVAVHGLTPDTAYEVLGSGDCGKQSDVTASSSDRGLLEFNWPVLSSCTMTVTLASQ